MSVFECIFVVFATLWIFDWLSDIRAENVAITDLAEPTFKPGQWFHFENISVPVHLVKLMSKSSDGNIRILGHDQNAEYIDTGTPWDDREYIFE